MVIDISYLSADDSRLDTSRPSGKKEEEALVLITWKDILQTADWTSSDDVNCPTFKSIGWMVSETEEEIKIGSTLVVEADDPQGTPFGITAFPKGCILSINKIG
jgi:hypothetical protein